MMIKRFSFVLLCVVTLLALAAPAQADDFLLTERGASTVYRWTPGGTPAAYHTVQSNDADFNAAQGSTDHWVAEHGTDHFGRFATPGGSGLDAQ